MPCRKRLQLIGRCFGRLTVVAAAGALGGKSHWTCSSKCSTEKIVCKEDLLRGRAKSCECLQWEANPLNGFKPGNKYGRCCQPVQTPT